MEVIVNYDKGILRILSSGDFSPNCDDFKKENGGRRIGNSKYRQFPEKFYCQKKKELGQKVAQIVGLKRVFFRWEK